MIAIVYAVWLLASACTFTWFVMVVSGACDE